MMRTMLAVFLCAGLILCGGCGRAARVFMPKAEKDETNVEYAQNKREYEH